MPVDTETYLLVRCSFCSREEAAPVSRFASVPSRPLILRCSCGEEKARIITRDRRNYVVEIICPYCEQVHRFHLKGRKIWSGELIRLFCSQVGLEIGYLGPHSKLREVSRSLREELEALVDELGGEDYFVNPEVMFEVLYLVEELAGEGGIFCPCGREDVEVELLPDGVVLRCRSCGRKATLPAATEADVRALEGMSTIKLFRAERSAAAALTRRKKRAKRRK
ncbi:hypothetical protein [Desulfothermobacter acidiphilus]|uniref:hypothetical protein n=1 Tax=Desulfothermobacter acidiphilus TaxID=1938353 RepID=UPI003F887D2A